MPKLNFPLNEQTQESSPLQKDRLKVHIDEPMAVAKLSSYLADIIRKNNPRLLRPLVIVCIGSDRSTGDSLGPLVGNKLKDLTRNIYYVYGSLDEPVHAANLEERLAYIRQLHYDPFIIAVDACLGKFDSVGCIAAGEGPLKPGAGVHKKLPPVGDCHISGIVNVSGFMEYLVLQNTRLSLVMKMADQIALSLFYAYHRSFKREVWEQ